MNASKLRALGVILGCIVFFYSNGQGTVFALPPICSDVCTTSTDCTDQCYIDMMEFDNGNAITCLQFGTFDSNLCCGDGYCASDYEDAGSCPSDCDLGITSPPTCGDFQCDPGESKRNCPTDCTSPETCGDSRCDTNETAGNCPADCTYADYCNGGAFNCPGWQTCRSSRCVYDPYATQCVSDFDCSGSGDKCIGYNSSTGGVCVPMF